MSIEGKGSRLRGNLAGGGKPEEPEPKLRGKLLNNESHSGDVSEHNLKGRILVQRDGGKEFLVLEVRSREGRGSVANLKSNDGKVTLDVDDLINKLKTPGSPWRLKE